MSEEYLVRDFMSAPATSLSQDASLLDAVLTFRRTQFRHVPIVDGETVVGILTERDVQRVAPSMLARITQEEYNDIFQNTPIKRVMTRNPLIITPATPLREAAALMNGNKVGCLPVVEGGRLVGILTVIDMLGVLVRVLSSGVAQQSSVQSR